MELWWNDTAGAQLKYLEKNLSRCCLSNIHPTWMALEPLQQNTSEQNMTGK